MGQHVAKPSNDKHKSEPTVQPTVHKLVLMGHVNSGISTFYNQLLPHPIPKGNFVFRECVHFIAKMQARSSSCDAIIHTILKQRNELKLYNGLHHTETIQHVCENCNEHLIESVKTIWNLIRDFESYKYYKGLEHADELMESLCMESQNTRHNFVKTRWRGTEQRSTIWKNVKLIDVGHHTRSSYWLHHLVDPSTLYFFFSLIEFDQLSHQQ